MFLDDDDQPVGAQPLGDNMPDVDASATEEHDEPKEDMPGDIA